MEGDGPSEELQEVEEELEKKKAEREGDEEDDEDVESGASQGKARRHHGFWCIRGFDNVKIFTQVASSALSPSLRLSLVGFELL